MRTRRSIVALLAFSLLVSGCATTEPTPINVSCEGVVSDPDASTFACNATASYNPNLRSTSIKITQANPVASAGVFTSFYTVEFPLKAGTFTAVTSGVSGTLSRQGLHGAWFAKAHAGDVNGGFALTINKFATIATSEYGAVYMVDGSLDATLPPVAGSGVTAPVNVHVVFKY